MGPAALVALVALLVLLVLLVLAAAGRTGSEVLIKVQESVLLKFILTVVQIQLQSCQNQTFMSLKEQFQMPVLLSAPQGILRTSSLPGTFICSIFIHVYLANNDITPCPVCDPSVCCCWQTRIIESKAIYTVYLRLTLYLLMSTTMLWESSSHVFIQMNRSIFLPKRAQHKLQSAGQMPVWSSARWKNNLNLCILYCLLFYLSISKTQNSSRNWDKQSRLA